MFGSADMFMKLCHTAHGQTDAVCQKADGNQSEVRRALRLFIKFASIGPFRRSAKTTDNNAVADQNNWSCYKL